jgi:hypothetical protein
MNAMSTTQRQRQAQRKATAASGAARRKKAQEAYRKLLPLIRRLRTKGLSFGKIPAQLNAAGHTTRQGKRWHPMQVWKVLDRAGLASE